MTTVAVLPVKRFDRAKQRLASGLAGTSRKVLAEAMLRDVLGALGRVRSLYAIVVVTGEPRAQALARAHDALIVEDQAERGQSAAASLGVDRAVEFGAERVLMVPGDCPALDATEVQALLVGQGDGPAVTIVPDRHGTGTNALLLSPPYVIAPAFGEGSCSRHRALAEASGARVAIAEVASLALDVDTPDDLDALRRAHVQDARRRHTPGVLRALAERHPA
ncbi:MAG TPA: 2-phospho-L-lactate guanylyltransferase [Solirubrobacteraceae bacterium]|nr:2-phospho-L-lactate guanylyltransferase [Solirubrobacteraceae bacterium]